MIWRKLLFIIGIWASGVASPISPLSLAELTTKADLVVVAVIDSVSSSGQGYIHIQGSTVPVDSFVARATISVVLKGSVPSSAIQFRFALPNSDSAPVKYKGVTQGTRRLIFLRDSELGYVFSDPFYPSAPAAPSVPADQSDPIANVIKQVAAVVESTSTSSQEKIEAIIALRTAHSQMIAPAFHVALASPGTRGSELHGYLLAELINHGDISELPLVKDILMSKQTGFPDYLVHNLSYSLSKVRDGRAVSELSTLLSAPRVETRRYAVEGLRNLGSFAIAALVLAIGNNDEAVRYSGVIGLANATGTGEWRPSAEEFHSNQEKYLAYWRTWARSRQDPHP